MIHRLRIVGSRERVVIALNDGFQAAPEQSEVGSIIVDAVRLYWVVIIWRDYIEAFWAERLNAIVGKGGRGDQAGGYSHT